MYFLTKTIHIFGAFLLFGTGLGTAFHMWATHLRGDVRAIAVVARNVVLADWLFTAPSGIAQPITGFLLIRMAGFDPLAPWVVVGALCYALAGLCWLAVVWLQMRIAALAGVAARDGTPLPPAYDAAMRAWFILGWPAFAALVLAVWLMVAKPELW